MIALVNEARRDRDLPSYRASLGLSNGAVDWSAHMSRTGTFAHATIARIRDDARTAGCSAGYVAENIAYTSAPASARTEQVFTTYMNSSGHRAAILSRDYTAIGIGTVTNSAGLTYNTMRFDGACSSPFIDLTPQMQHYGHMAWMAQSQISTGWSTAAGPEYRPLNAVNRDAMAAFLYRMADKPTVTLPAQSPFTDIDSGDQHYRAVIWAYQRGITTGWSEEGGRTFRPTEPIARDAMAAFLYRFAGRPSASASSCFEDVSAGTRFATAMCWMKTAGISTGWSDGTYRPSLPVLRDAMAAFLHRYSEEVRS